MEVAEETLPRLEFDVQSRLHGDEDWVGYSNGDRDGKQ